ncbi:MAG: helix-hairpin-helix domain-containing protein, partial [Haemophilus parainfluenzae]|nr:helix-hairpin-helix domain-containing protein [Haemophilus parainfluenzae]
ESTKADMKNASNDKLKSMTDSASSKKSTALAKVKEAKENATSAKDAMKDKSTSAKDAVKEKASALKEKAASTKDAAKEKVTSSAKVNVNKADAETLQKLSGIGEKKAQAIIDYRNKVGKIKNAAELSNIDGIGEATIEKITPFLSF